MGIEGVVGRKIMGSLEAWVLCLWRRGGGEVACVGEEADWYVAGDCLPQGAERGGLPDYFCQKGNPDQIRGIGDGKTLSCDVYAISLPTLLIR